MVYFPTFLSFPWTLPSLPPISLPANIQRRFLSYVLKRTLGRFVKPGGLDVERIQAQISEGWVEIEGLEVAEDEINSLLPPSLPITLSSGSLSKVTGRIPFPNLWSAPLSITLDTLTLDFTTLYPSSPTSSKGKDPATPRQSRSAAQATTKPTSPSLDLTASVTTAADEFLHEELDAYQEAELDRSIRESLVLSQNDPFTKDDLPGSFPFGSPTRAPDSAAEGDPGSPIQSPGSAHVESTTVLAGVIERVLARLDFKVHNIRIRLHHHDSAHGSTIDLRIAKILYMDESEAQDGIETSKSTTRTVKVSGIEIYMMPLSSTRSQTTTPTRSRSARRTRSSLSSASTSSTESSEDSYQSGDANAEMMMSQAVADLRQSMATSSVAGESVYESAYESALSEQEEDEPSPKTFKRQGTPERSKTATPTPGHTEPTEQLLLSFGSEDLIVRMTTTRPTPQPVPARPTASNGSRPNDSSALPSIQIDVMMGTLACLLLPTQIESLLSIARALVIPTSYEMTTPPAPHPQPTIQPRLSVNLRLDNLFVVVVYDMAIDCAGDDDFEGAVRKFWRQPGTTYLPVGQLKLRVDSIEANYAFPGSSPGSRGVTRRSTGQPGPPRTSSSFNSGPNSSPDPVSTLNIKGISIFEYLASAQTDSGAIPGGVFPVLIFDSNLVRQYDLPNGPISGTDDRGSSKTGSIMPDIGTSERTFPAYDTIDWRDVQYQRRGQGEKLWRVRPKARGSLRQPVSSEMADAHPVVSIRIESSDDESALLELLPVHVYLDLSLIERLLPLLRYIAPAIRRPRTQSGDSSPVTPKHGGGSGPGGRSLRTVIDDLESPRTTPAIAGRVQGNLVVVKCPMVRLDVRCPAPPMKKGTWGDNGSLRSGIVTLDVHSLTARLGTSAAVPSRVTIVLPTEVPTGTSLQSRPMATVDCQKAIVLFCRAPEKRSAALFVIGPLAPEPGDTIDDVLLPSVEVTSGTNDKAGNTVQETTCRVPAIQAQIRQDSIEGLQFFADDLTHWLDGAFGDGSKPKPRDELKLIGSRFFGSKGSSSTSSVMFEDEEALKNGVIIRLLVSEFDTRLHVPRAPTSSGTGERIFSLRASDIDTRVESNTSGRPETSVIVAIMDADLIDKSDISLPSRIFGRTTPPTLMHQTTARPLLHLIFRTFTDPHTESKESDITASLSNATLYVKDDFRWAQDLALFVKTPEGVFEDVVPSEITRINLDISDASLHVKAPKEKGAIVLVMGDLQASTDITSDAYESVVSAGMSRCQLLAIDDVAVAGHLQPGYKSSADAWKSAGWAPLIEILVVECQLFRDLSGSREISLDVLRSQVRITACADSMATLGELVADIGTLAPRSEVLQESIRSPVALDQSIDVFASVDEDAFHRMPDVVSGVDMIEDDLPTNLEYLDSTTRRPRRRSSGQDYPGYSVEDELSSQLEGSILEVKKPVQNGETIKILVDEPFEMQEDYWNNLPVIVGPDNSETSVGKFRVRVHDASVSVFLHDGFDWQGTRKAIEDEIKAVRKRLEKIRQLLASGQKADETEPIQGARSVLFNSVYIGLDEQKEDLDSAALLAAIDEELDGLATAETASQSSWQTDFPPGQGVPTKVGRGQKKSRLRGKRLTRSKKAQIEVTLQRIKVELDSFDKESPTASRVAVTVGSMEILDHIKTSTWKKFLTEMKSDSRGNVRETDADMMRVELLSVRPNLRDPTGLHSSATAGSHGDGGVGVALMGEESRLKAKILPLRLHVDQDALDFFKRFFSFSEKAQKNKGAAKGATAPGPGAVAGPFFQHVEIFAIELKLDYKPKRVDLAALREGKTIELMNFFHFDGAEMTLRHVTLSGITGWERLSTTLQDIWTPDVKANQLADVISGVSPIRSLVNVGSGVADLILLPIEQYRKDGRVGRGVQRGTSSFVRSTAMEMMKLGARLATGTQVVLEKAEGMLGGKLPEMEVSGDLASSIAPGSGSASGAGGPPVAAGGAGEMDSEDEEGEVEREVISRYANQPGGAREGVKAAYKSLSRNVNGAAQTILAVPMEVYERSGGGDDAPLRAVVRAVPIAVLKPMIGASEAVSKTLLGVRNSLDPQGKLDQGDKYK